MNHLRNMISHYNTFLAPSVHITLPVVKLDLPNGQCPSAILGIMKQPSGEKICSLQAVILGLSQCGLSSDISSSLLNDLSRWLDHILTAKIKKGKELIVLPRVGDASGDPELYQPIERVASHLERIGTKIVANKGGGKEREREYRVKYCEKQRDMEWRSFSDVMDLSVKRISNLSTSSSLHSDLFSIQSTRKYSVLSPLSPRDRHKECMVLELQSKCSSHVIVLTNCSCLVHE